MKSGEYWRSEFQLFDKDVHVVQCQGLSLNMVQGAVCRGWGADLHVQLGMCSLTSLQS